MWNTTHLTLGLALTALFLLTGLFMNSQFPELYGDDQVVRFMYRASHIYLLFAALLHLAWSQAAPSFDDKRLRFLLPNVGLILGSAFLIVAFCIEPARRMEERGITLVALYALVGATIFKVMVQVTDRKKKVVT